MPDRLPSRSQDIIISGALPKRLSAEELQAQQQKQLDNRNALLIQVHAISADYYARMLTSAALRNRDTENPSTKPHLFNKNRHSSWALQCIDRRDKGYERYDLDYSIDQDGAVVSANKLVASFGETQYVKPHTTVTVKTDKQKYVSDVKVRWKDDLHYQASSLLSKKVPYDRVFSRRASLAIDFVESFCTFENSFDAGAEFIVNDGYDFKLDQDPKLSIYRFSLFFVRPIWWVTAFHYDSDNNQFFRPLNDKDNERCTLLGVSKDDTMKVDTYLAILRETLGLVRASH